MNQGEVGPDQHIQELRRGTIVLAALVFLTEPHYGYDLLTHLDKAGFSVEGNTLYPLLRRLERQGLLTSEWNTDEARPRKFYLTTPAGQTTRAALVAEWSALDSAITALTKGQQS